MRTYVVAFTPEAEIQLAELYRYLATVASPEIADRYTSEIVQHCGSLQRSPNRGVKRDDIRPGLRIMGHKRRVVIAFEVGEAFVNIIGVYYGGQNYEGALLIEGDEG